jgi:hypothetical protein
MSQYFPQCQKNKRTPELSCAISMWLRQGERLLEPWNEVARKPQQLQGTFKWLRNCPQQDIYLKDTYLA